MQKEIFGAFIAHTRKEQGLTQKALADKLHVTDKAISKWERGLCYPDLTLMEDLAAIYYQMHSTDSVRSLSNYQWHFSQN